MSWYMEILDNVFSYLEYTLEEKGVDIYCTTEMGKTSVDEDGKPNLFPTMYIHELQPIERGQDLTNTSVNAVLSTMEIQIYTKTKSECKTYCGLVTECMKELNFNITMMPVITYGDDYYVGIARYRRLVGSGDTTIVN